MDSSDLSEAVYKTESQMISEVPEAFSDPDLLRVLTASNSSKEDIEKVTATLAQRLPKTAKIFQFQSVVIRDKTFVMVLPSEKEDVYLHTHPKYSASYNVIVARKQTADGKPIYPPKMDFFDVDGETRRSHNGNQFCTTCHRSGTVAILPVDGKFISLTPGMSNDEIKNWWENYRLTDMDRRDVFSTENLAPPIGPEHLATRTDDFVRQCAKKDIPEITSDRVTQIRKNMDCMVCHNYGRPEILRFPTHMTRNFDLEILENVVHSGHMPLDSDKKENKLYLNELEHKALFTCLKAEYFGGFREEKYSQGNQNIGILLNYLTKDCKISADTSDKPQKKAK